jgi:hypothetical protein
MTVSLCTSFLSTSNPGAVPQGLETFLSISPEAPRSRSKKSKQEEIYQETSLSGGQWQKTSLARAFMAVPSSSFVVLDEPSSALDARAEQYVPPLRRGKLLISRAAICLSALLSCKLDLALISLSLIALLDP